MAATQHHETASTTLVKLGLVVVLSISATALESLRADFYYANAPYLYPVFYIFASVFLGLRWGLFTAFVSLVLISIWTVPSDFLGLSSISIHVLQATWLGIQAKKNPHFQVFSEGLKFWLWCGAPILCIAAYPYFLEFSWSGTTIVLQEISSNIFSLLIFAIIFHSSRARKRLAFLSPSAEFTNKHNIRYTCEIGVAALIILPAQLFLVTEYVVRDDASNSEFLRLTKTTSGLYAEYLRARSEGLYLRASSVSAEDAPSLVPEILAESLKDFPSVCGAVMITARSEPVVTQNACSGINLPEIPTSLRSNQRTSAILLPDTSSRYMTHRVRSSEFELFIFMEDITLTTTARQLAGVTSETDHLYDVKLSGRDDPWGALYSETVAEPEADNSHFFSRRLNERLVYEFPATLSPTWAASGLRIEFSARAFAQSKLRDTGIFLSIMILTLLSLIIFIRLRIKGEVEGVQQLANFLQDYSPHSNIDAAIGKFEIAEFDNLKTAVMKLRNNLNTLQEQQARSVVEVQSQAGQLRGMVEQSQAFLLLVHAGGSIADQNRIARSREYAFIRKSFVSAVKTHTTNTAADTTEDVIYETALAWLDSGKSRHFQEIKVPFSNADDIRPLTLQFGYYGTTKITYFARIEDISEFMATKEKLAHTSRLAELGELATGVAHELSQPLNAIIMSSSNITNKLDKGDLTNSYLRSKLIRIQEQVARSGKIIGDLKSFARAKILDHDLTDTALIITQSIDMVRSQFELDSITVEARFCNDTPTVSVNSQQIEQVLINLFNNAKHVMKKQGGGQLTIIESVKGDKASIVVRDTGPGVEQALRDKIFTPFYTTKISEGGTGLGLSISHKIMQDHGGSLMLLESTRGASFELLIPIASAEGR